MKKLVFAAMLGMLLFPMVAAAQVDHSKDWAIGYFDANAPIGFRYVFSPKAAVDFGVGFATAKVFDYASASGGEKTKFQFHGEVGIPITIVQKDRINFFFRPGFLMKMIPYYYAATSTATPESKTAMDYNLSALLGVEWFVTDDFSLSVGHGLQMQSSKGVSLGDYVEGSEPESSTTFNGLQALDITKIGFRYYF